MKKICIAKGVTGSGKTEVYMRLVEKTLEEGKVSYSFSTRNFLTPQMIERFKGRFGSRCSIIS